MCGVAVALGEITTATGVRHFYLHRGFLSLSLSLMKFMEWVNGFLGGGIKKRFGGASVN